MANVTGLMDDRPQQEKEAEAPRRRLDLWHHSYQRFRHFGCCLRHHDFPELHPARAAPRRLLGGFLALCSITYSAF